MKKLTDVYHKATESKITLIINAVLGLSALLIYLSAHTVLGFIGYATFTAMPYILGVLFAAGAVVALVLLFYKNQKVVLTVSFIWNALAFCFSAGYFIGFVSHYKTFLLEGAKILAVYAFIAAITYLAFFHGDANYRGKKIVAGILCAVLVLGGLLFTDLDTLRINYIDGEPAVFAVEDDYQIVWTTAVKGSGWVEIDGVSYYDEYAGQKRTSERVHKVTVPQSALDESKRYSINSKAMLSEQGFSGLSGYTVKKSYSFRPVDVTDGIQAYVIADTHDFINSAVKAASYYGDKTDFIVMAGDHVNYLNDSSSQNRILELAHRASNGSVPIVFARGNHELKCEYSESLHRYVGSQNEKFYYTFRLKNVWGVVLDMGEDHEDEWKEFYNTALYEDYRKDQIAFLDKIIADKADEYEADGVEYKIGVCHVPTSFISYKRTYMFESLVAINERLNEIGLDAMLSGHLHEVFLTEPGYEAGRPLFYRAEYTGESNDDTPDCLATGAHYPNLICGRRAHTLSSGKESAIGYEYTGTAIEFLSDGKYARFTTKNKQILYSISPFENKEYGKIMEL